MGEGKGKKGKGLLGYKADVCHSEAMKIPWERAQGHIGRKNLHLQVMSPPSTETQWRFTLQRIGPNNLFAESERWPYHKMPHVALNSSVSIQNDTGPNRICTVSLVLQSWTWSALLCKIHIKPPGPVGLWPEGKIGYKLKDLSTTGFWKGKNQEQTSYNSLILVPCWTPPWTRSAKKRIKEKTWKRYNLASSVDCRLFLLGGRQSDLHGIRPKQQFSSKWFQETVFVGWLFSLVFFLKCWSYEVCNPGSCQIMETVCFCHYRHTVPLWPEVKQLWARVKALTSRQKSGNYLSSHIFPSGPLARISLFVFSAQPSFWPISSSLRNWIIFTADFGVEVWTCASAGTSGLWLV